MVTLKDIAEKTGFSQSTVSIVLRGLSEERHIPDETRIRIQETARSLGYTPNTSAKRLRSVTAVKTIAIFWANDFRREMVAHFFQGVYQYMLKNAPEYEIIICPYNPGKLDEAVSAVRLSMYAGCSVCNAAENDLAYLDGLDTLCPIVVYNRPSERYSYVQVDNTDIGKCAARELVRDGCGHLVLISDRMAFPYLISSARGFEEAGKEEGLVVETILTRDPSSIIGRDLAGTVLHALGHTGPDGKPLRTGIFICSSDQTTFGLVSGLNDLDVHFPQDVSLITVGTGSDALYACFLPKLSVIQIPLEQMAEACAGRIHEMIEHRETAQKKVTVPFRYVQGNTTRNR